MRFGKVCQMIAVGVVGGGLALSASADIINFDDLIGQAPVPPGYGTVQDWTGWTYYDWAQHPYNPHSPPCRVYTSSGTFKFGRDVVFDGAWFAGHGTSRGFQPIYFTLYRGGQLVHTSSQIDLQSDGVPTWLASGYTGLIDTVTVNGSHGFYIMDDVTFFEAGGLRLSLTGDCPGRVTVSWNGATPSRPMGIALANSTGNFTIPGGACGGTTLGLSNSGLQLAYTGNTGAGGSGQVSSNVGTAACGKFIQMVVADGNPCTTSNVVQLP